jgi:hypothetical protein
MQVRGSKSSWKCLIAKAFPVFVNNSKNDIDLAPTQADTLFTSQLATPFPQYLATNAFKITSVVSSTSESEKIHRTLTKDNTLLSPPSVLKPEEKVTVNTSTITEDFASQHSYLSIRQQRKVIAVLHFWERECARWRLLDEEEADISKAMEEEEGMSGGARMDLGVRLREVRMKKFLIPSQRMEGSV